MTFEDLWALTLEDLRKVYVKSFRVLAPNVI